ncbi:ATP-binding protein [Marivita sp. S2033]|uniref:sensor histidine kinase n=1 Tax=Marivita sp. S2033 TaxID=3373187 RepID=UPI0039824D9D
MKLLWVLLRRVDVLSIIAACLMVGVVLDNLSLVRHRADQRLMTLEEAYKVQSALANEVNEKLLLSQGVMAAIAARPDITQSDFTRAVSHLVEDIDNIINVAAAPDLIFRHVYPFEANKKVVGLDLSDFPEQLGAVREALETGQTIFDGPNDLVQGGRGFITRTPVDLYYSGESQSSFWGIVSLVIDADGFFQSAGVMDTSLPYRLSVTDQDGQLLTGEAIPPEADPAAVKLEKAGINWTIQAIPATGWATSPPNRIMIWSVVLVTALFLIAIAELIRWAFAKKDKAEIYLKEALDALSDGFALYDQDGKLIMCNQKYREQYPAASDIMEPGTSLEAILRRGLDVKFYPAAIGRETEWLAERLNAQKHPGQVFEQELSDGRWLRLEERRTPSGTLAGLRVDITELKMALQRAESANAIKTDFLNALSHELRTPLSVVLGYNAFLNKPDVLPSYKSLEKTLEDANDEAAALQLKAVRDDITKFAGHIDLSGKQLMALLSNLLDIDAIERGSLKIEMEPLDLRAVLDDVIAENRARAEAKGLRLEVDHGAEGVCADPARLRQILSNVVSNALKFTNAGDVTIRTCHPDPRAEFTRIEVSDTGEGISQSEINTIFDTFYQSDSTSSRKHGGLGLGLSMVKKLIDLHDGSINVQSEIGQGTTVQIDLPSAELELATRVG